MNPGGLKLFLRLGAFVVLLGVFLVFTVPRDSAEFVVSVLALLTGLLLVGLVLLVNWWSGR